MAELSPLTQKLIKNINRFEKDYSERKEVGFLKQTKKERSLRRKVIEKALQGILTKKEPFSAEKFLTEVTNSGCFPGKTLEKSKIKEIQTSLNKYTYIVKNIDEKDNTRKKIFSKWVLLIAAYEIEEILSGPSKEHLLVLYTFRSLKRMLKIKKEDEKKSDLLLYIAVQQSLFNLSLNAIIYHVLELKYENWKNPSSEELKKISFNIHKDKEEVKQILNHPLFRKVYLVCKNYNTPYLIIGDIISRNLKDIKASLSDTEKAEKIIIDHYEKRINEIKTNLSRTVAIFTTMIFTVFLFLTGITALLGEVTLFSAIFTVLVPTSLAAFLAFAISPPPEKNRKKVVLQTMKALYKKEEVDVYFLEKGKEKKTGFRAFVFLFYAVAFLVFMGTAFWVLGFIYLPLISRIIFLASLPVIAFKGLKISGEFKDLYMIEVKEKPIGTLLDILAFPLIHLEKYIAQQKEKPRSFPISLNISSRKKPKEFPNIWSRLRSYLWQKKEDIYREN